MKSLEDRTITALPQADETAEEAALFINAATYEEALDDEGEEDGWAIVASDIADVQKRTGAVILAGTETHRLLSEAIIRAKLAAINGRLRFLRDEASEPPAMFVSGGINPRTLQPVTHIPRPKAKSAQGGKTFREAAEDFIAELQRDPNAALREQTRLQYEMTFRLFADYSHNAFLTDIDRGLASGFIEAIAKLDPSWGRKSGTKTMSLAELLEVYGDVRSAHTDNNLPTNLGSGVRISSGAPSYNKSFRTRPSQKRSLGTLWGR